MSAADIGFDELLKNVKTNIEEIFLADILTGIVIIDCQNTVFGRAIKIVYNKYNVGIDIKIHFDLSANIVFMKDALIKAQDLGYEKLVKVKSIEEIYEILNNIAR